MTTNTVAVPARVTMVLATVSTWTPGRRKSDGKRFYFIPSATSDAVYMTAVDGCTCPAAQNGRSGDCKHQAAVRQHGITAPPASRPSYGSIFPECRTDGCKDVSEHKNGLCDRCSSDLEHVERMESKRLDIEARMQTTSTARATEAWL